MLAWIGDDGPLVLLPVAVAMHWNDYARACATLPQGICAAVVRFNGGTALALETEGQQVAVLHCGQELTLASWTYAESVTHAERALSAFQGEHLHWTEKSAWSVPPGGVVLQPAAERFDARAAVHPLAAGTYVVSVSTFAPDKKTRFELFGLRRAAVQALRND